MQQSWFIGQWRNRMTNHILEVYPELKKKTDKINSLLDKLIEDNLKDRKMYLMNNYLDVFYKTSVLGAMELIMNKNLIIGGGSCLYVQHKTKLSLLFNYITKIMDERKLHKKLRSKYEKYSKEWVSENILQQNFKIKINSLYGVLGYFRFILYNIFLAESVTAMGQHIITSASTGFENFLADNIPLMDENQAYEYISNIITEAKQYKDSDLDLILDDIPIDTVFNRLLIKCDFVLTEKFKDNILKILTTQNKMTLLMLYYKNNFFEFCKTPFMKNRMIQIFENINVLMVGDISGINSDEVKMCVTDLWKFIEVFTFYNYCIPDRVRKAKYLNRNPVVYIDTDSNMLSVNRWVRYICDEIIPKTKSVTMSTSEIEYTAANIMAIYAAIVVDKVLGNMCKNMNITDEYAKLLAMKNEYYYRRMLFVANKKRYIALMILQEGVLLNSGNGFPDIKGFDFIKSTTKEYLREAYTNMCLNDILLADDINVTHILKKIFAIQADIEKSLDDGDTKFFKQSNVNTISHYKKPYSIQGIKAVILWNAVIPKYAIELPSDVDIIPIKPINNPYPIIKDSNNYVEGFDFSKKRKETDGNVLLAEKYPEIYDIIDKEIWHNPVLEIAKMELNTIAKPKNSDLDLPDWYFDLIDKDKIIDDSLKLIMPVLKSLGIKITRPNSKKTHISNIVAI